MPIPSKDTTERTVSQKSNYVAATEYEAQFWTLLNDFETSLQSMVAQSKETSTKSQGKNSLSDETESIVSDIERLNSTVAFILDDIIQRKESSLLLLSRRDDLLRQMEESARMLKMHNEGSDSHGNVSKSQKLDIESEKMRRRLVNGALKSQICLARTREKMLFLGGLLKNSNSTKSMQFSWTPHRAAKRQDRSSELLVLYQHLKSEFDKTRVLESSTRSFDNKLVEMQRTSHPTVKNAVSPIPRMKGSRGYRNRQKLAPLPFSPPTSMTKQSKVSETKMSTISAIHSLKKEVSTQVKHIKRRDLLSTLSVVDKQEAGPWRSNDASALMLSLSTSQSSNLPIASPDPNLRMQPSLKITDKPIPLRSGWKSVDMKALESAHLTLPNTLKQIDASEASKQALAPFGVTPENMAKVQETKERGLVKSSTGLKKSISNIRVDNAIGSFPPLSSKAPTPFGKTTTNKESGKDKSTQSSSQVSNPVPKPKTEAKRSSDKASAAFPPIPSKAPTPFGGSKSSKTTPSEKISKSSSDFPPLASNAPTPFGLSKPSKATSSDKTVTTPSIPLKESKKDDKSEKPSGLFGSMASLGSALTTPAVKPPLPPKQEVKTTIDGSLNAAQVNYESVLTQFYQRHNPAKVSEVTATLTKYKVRYLLHKLVLVLMYSLFVPFALTFMLL